MSLRRHNEISMKKALAAAGPSFVAMDAVAATINFLGNP
jgi:hypothetical protein